MEDLDNLFRQHRGQSLQADLRQVTSDCMSGAEKLFVWTLILAGVEHPQSRLKGKEFFMWAIHVHATCTWYILCICTMYVEYANALCTSKINVHELRATCFDWYNSSRQIQTHTSVWEQEHEWRRGPWMWRQQAAGKLEKKSQKLVTNYRGGRSILKVKRVFCNSSMHT